jgi:hypothetical protein
MNISSIASASGMTGVTGANQDDFRTRMQQAMAPVAQLFGMSSDDLMSAVKASGGSLADYAASKGISSTDLTAAIKQGLQANAPNGVQLSDSQLTNMAQRIESHKPGDGPQGPPPDGGAVSMSATSSNSTIKTELEKLIADLKASESTASTDGTTSSSTSTSSTSTIKTDLDKLIADLKTSESQADSSTTSSTGSNPVSTNALLDVLTRFDQQL